MLCQCDPHILLRGRQNMECNESQFARCRERFLFVSATTIVILKIRENLSYVIWIRYLETGWLNNLLIACPQGILALLFSGSSSHVIISGASLSSTASSSCFSGGMSNPPGKRSTRNTVDPCSRPYSERRFLFSSCLPANITRCMSAGIPFFLDNNIKNSSTVASWKIGPILKRTCLRSESILH